MSHVKNAEAFARLVDFCTGYGGKYNPGRPTLRMEALINQLKEANKALEQVVLAKSLYDNEVNKRKQVFDQLPRLASSIMRTLEASGVTPEKVDDAQLFFHQITGHVRKDRAPVPSQEAQQAKVHRSTLQLAYVSRADSFAKLVQAVSTEPLYLANEAELNPEGLFEKVKELDHLNKQVSVARVQWSNALINRNDLMYRHSRSLHETTRAVKKYVYAIYGHDSEQYAQVSTIRFIKPGRL